MQGSEPIKPNVWGLQIPKSRQKQRITFEEPEANSITIKNDKTFYPSTRSHIEAETTKAIALKENPLIFDYDSIYKKNDPSTSTDTNTKKVTLINIYFRNQSIWKIF